MYLCTGISKATEKYTPATDSYENLAEAPRSRYRHAAAAVGGRIYLFGGCAIDDSIITDIDVLDTTGRWSTAGSWPNATSDLSAFAHDGKIYVLGGYNRPDYLAMTTVTRRNQAAQLGPRLLPCSRAVEMRRQRFQVRWSLPWVASTMATGPTRSLGGPRKQQARRETAVSIKPKQPCENSESRPACWRRAQSWGAPGMAQDRSRLQATGKARLEVPDESGGAGDCSSRQAQKQVTRRLSRLDAHRALETFATLAKQKVQLNAFHASAVVAACSKESQWQQSLALLSELAQQTIQTDVVVFNSATCKQWQTALDLCLSMRGISVPPNDKTHCTASNACAGASQWEESLRITDTAFRDASSAKVACNTALRACGTWSLWRSALEVAASLRRCFIELDQVAATTTIRLLTSASQWQLSLQSEQVTGVIVSEDPITSSALMAAQGEAALWEEALSLLWIMVSNRSADVFSFSTAITACTAGSTWELALELLGSMSKEQIPPNVVALSATQAAAAAGSRWREAMELLTSMLETTQAPNEITLMAAIDACGSGQKWNAALGLLMSAEELRIRLSQASYTVAMTACEAGRQWEQALCTLRSMPSAALIPNEISLSATTLACQRHAGWAIALQLLPDRGSAKVGLGSVSALRWAALLGSCENVEQWSLALSLMIRLASSRVQSSAMAGNAALSACAAASRWCQSLNILGLDAGVRPSAITFSSMLSACNRSGHWLHALGTVRLLQTRGVKQTSFGATAVILCCAEQSCWMLALRMHEEQSAGVEGLAGIAQACSQRSDLMLPMLPLLDSVEGSTLGALKNLSYHASFQVVQVGGGGGRAAAEVDCVPFRHSAQVVDSDSSVCVCVDEGLVSVFSFIPIDDEK
eukprot:s632_g3.t4